MAIRYAVANGNWNTGSTWDNGATLDIPTVGDDVYANNFTVNVNQSFQVASLSNASLAAASTRLNPVMTSNTTPSGIASASSVGGANAAWLAFNGSFGVGNSWGSNAAAPQWIQYQFTSSLIVRSYSIYYDSNITGRPTSFNLQGSNDGISFTTLDTRTSFAFTNGQYNTLTITNPTSSFSTYRLNITATDGTGNPAVPELTFNEIGVVSLTAGGSFNFNSGSISGSCTRTVANTSLVIGATNPITVTATTGNVTLTLGSTVQMPEIASINGVSYTGACNFTITSPSLAAMDTGNNFAFNTLINKSSIGQITINGNLIGGRTGNSGTAGVNALLSTAGNTIVNGNVSANAGTVLSQIGPNYAINQSSGILTINGNITGGGAGASSSDLFRAIIFSGTLLNINGNITGGAGSTAIITSALTNTVTGSVSGGTSATGAPAISSTSANTIIVSGSCIATASPAVVSTNTAASNIFTGPFINTNDTMAVQCVRMLLTQDASTSWNFGNITLFSPERLAFYPSASDIRQGVTYADGTVSGSLAMPPPTAVIAGTPTDNTTGSAVLTATQLQNAFWGAPLSQMTNTGSIGARLAKSATLDSTGNQLASYLI